MRRTVILATIALVAATVPIGAASIITASTSDTATAAPASAPISVMQMMIEAKDLPEQQFDAI
jgi:hypothetical protein